MLAGIDIHKRVLQSAVLGRPPGGAEGVPACLTRGGWPWGSAGLLTACGRRWVQGLALPPASRAQAELIVRLIEQLERETETLEAELRRFAKTDPRCQRLT